MEALALARWQFGITTVYHFIFVPLTLGLSVLTAIMQTIYYRTGDDVYKKMTLFWGKLFVILFTLGVVTGIVQEFQFGMNWSSYSRFVGDIFGIPLAIEALLAFFMESTFIGISAWNLWKNGPTLMFGRSIRIALVFTAVAAILTATTGHDQAQDTVTSQPMKMAAMEAEALPYPIGIFTSRDEALAWLRSSPDDNS